MTLMFFTACRNVDKQLKTNEQLAPDEQLTAEEQLIIEDFLSDFDYLMQAMEDVFPYFGVAERRLGVDIRALGRETRAIIENYPIATMYLGKIVEMSDYGTMFKNPVHPYTQALLSAIPVPRLHSTKEKII